MRNIIDFLNEARGSFDPKDKVGGSMNNLGLIKYLAKELGKDREDFFISPDGIKYKKKLVPGTKLGTGLTGEEILDKVFDFVTDKNDEKEEKKEFDLSKKIKAYDSNSDFLDFLADELDKDREDFYISAEGVKYKNSLVPGTKLSLDLTADEILDKVLDFVNKKDEKDEEPTKVKKSRRAEWLVDTKGNRRSRNYGEYEKQQKRREEENNRIIKGQRADDEINPSYYKD